MEVNNHKSLDHPHVVKFKTYFEDETSYYIVLELCNQRVEEEEDTSNLSRR